MNIRVLGAADASSFQALRLDALQESPTAFGASHEEECNRSEQQIERHLVGSAERKFFGCFDAGELVGIVGVGREQGSKERHVAFVRSMYVKPGARGRGIGRRLLLAALGQARAWSGVEQVTLAVTATNEAALQLYRKAGFVEVGRMPRALRVGSHYHDEITMLCMLSAG